MLLLAIIFSYVTYYPVTLSLPFQFGADHLKQEWRFSELFVFRVVIRHFIIWLLTLQMLEGHSVSTQPEFGSFRF